MDIFRAITEVMTRKARGAYESFKRNTHDCDRCPVLGATGPMMEWLLHTTSITAFFMLFLRLIIAGTLLLLFLQLSGKKVMPIWKLPAWRNRLLLFSIVGMLGLQFTFVKTIEESNAIVATLLQFLAPIFIIIYISVKHKKLPPKAQVIGIAGTLVGLVVFGSAAFVLFLSSLNFISPVETSVLSSVEPLTATVISVIWLGSSMYGWQYFGMLLMLIFVVYLSVAGKEKKAG
jgi:drug/metabolite transporter (DMT)-like permease